MAAVPKIWDVIKKGIQAKVAAGSPVVQFLVKTGFEWRAFCMKHGFDAPLFKKVVFKKFSAAVGGKLRMALSGGGPINAEVQEFCRVAFGIKLVQGYGLTETCAGGTVQAPDDYRNGVAGVPIPSVEIKLESTPEICDKAGQPYLTKDRRDVDGEPVFGRGEILIKGNCVAVGYYMMPNETKDAFESNGWFHTGDIGQFLSDGSVKIVDRKKNLVKLKGGEYIAMEQMEMTYGNSSFVDAINGGICCYGDGDMDRPVAILQLNEAFTMKWAKDRGIPGDFETIKNSKELHDAIMKDMLEQHAKSSLSHLEKLQGVAVLTSPWTPENGCLTAANKLQRRVVVETFKKEFEEVKKQGIFDA
jgi:long-chain acyl-CoA synthetase